MTTIDYDSSRRIIASLSAHRDESRGVHWFDEARAVGVARGERGRVEIFLPGGELTTRLPTVSNLMHQGTWTRSNPVDHFEAARLMLPPGDAYDAIAATVVVELSRSGLDSDRQAAFSSCEALIEVALLQADLVVESVLGLWGELFLLRLWLDQPGSTTRPLEAWCGYRPSARDFTLGRVGVEVKTTLRDTSSHQVTGVHQTEPAPSDDRLAEEDLLLVSVGLEPVDSGITVLDLVSQIEELIRSKDVDLADEFQVHVSDYAGRSTGYRRCSENQPRVLSQGYGVTFVRGYDMSDPLIEVLRLVDVQARPHVQTDSVTFRINLPSTLAGDVNPVPGPLPVVRWLAARSEGC